MSELDRRQWERRIADEISRQKADMKRYEAAYAHRKQRVKTCHIASTVCYIAAGGCAGTIGYFYHMHFPLITVMLVAAFGIGALWFGAWLDGESRE